jgi:hypothetical protein
MFKISISYIGMCYSNSSSTLFFFLHGWLIINFFYLYVSLTVLRSMSITWNKNNIIIAPNCKVHLIIFNSRSTFLMNRSIIDVSCLFYWSRTNFMHVTMWCGHFCFIKLNLGFNYKCISICAHIHQFYTINSFKFLTVLIMFYKK